MKNDAIELYQAVEDLLFFRQQITFSTEKIIVLRCLHIPLDLCHKKWYNKYIICLGGENMDLRKYIGEATEYDKKAMLEEKKPKSWCKSVSAFANGKGGVLIFGIANDDTMLV